MRARMWSRSKGGLPASALCLVLLPAMFALGSCAQSRPQGSSERVTFRTQDGFVLEGTLFGSGSKAVVLAHMYPADESSWFDFARRLEDHGYLALTFNFRGYGKSQGDKDVAVIDRDVRAAIDFVRGRKGVTGVALAGASMGGTASLIAASASPVDAVVTLSAPVEFMGLDASHAVSLAKASKYFIASTEDVSAADSAGRLYRSSDPPRDIELIPGKLHGTGILEGPKGEEMAAKIIAFIDKAFSSAGPS